MTRGRYSRTQIRDAGKRCKSWRLLNRYTQSAAAELIETETGISCSPIYISQVETMGYCASLAVVDYLVRLPPASESDPEIKRDPYGRALGIRALRLLNLSNPLTVEGYNQMLSRSLNKQLFEVPLPGSPLTAGQWFSERVKATNDYYGSSKWKREAPRGPTYPVTDFSDLQRIYHQSLAAIRDPGLMAPFLPTAEWLAIEKSLEEQGITPTGKFVGTENRGKFED